LSQSPTSDSSSAEAEKSYCAMLDQPAMVAGWRAEAGRAECHSGGSGADDDGADQAGAGLMRPNARADADEGWKRKDGEREQQPAKHADGGKRTEMAARGVWANVRAMPQRIKPPAFSSYLYKLRNLVERLLSQIKHYRAVAPRYEKHPENYLAVIQLAAASI
jgi:hypothetical protein